MVTLMKAAQASEASLSREEEEERDVLCEAEEEEAINRAIQEEATRYTYACEALKRNEEVLRSQLTDSNPHTQRQAKVRLALLRRNSSSDIHEHEAVIAGILDAKRNLERRMVLASEARERIALAHALMHEKIPCSALYRICYDHMHLISFLTPGAFGCDTKRLTIKDKNGASICAENIPVYGCSLPTAFVLRCELQEAARACLKRPYQESNDGASLLLRLSQVSPQACTLEASSKAYGPDAVTAMSMHIKSLEAKMKYSNIPLDMLSVLTLSPYYIFYGITMTHDGEATFCLSMTTYPARPSADMIPIHNVGTPSAYVRRDALHAAALRCASTTTDADAKKGAEYLAKITSV